MQCPKCQGNMILRARGHHPVDECLGCGSIWFDQGELEQATSAASSDTAWMEVNLWKDARQFELMATALHCPRCNAPMAAVQYGSTQVIVDVCARCKGVFLDKGEFYQIIHAFQEELAHMSSDDYRRAALQEVRELLQVEGGLLSDWQHLGTVLRLMQYRLLAEHPRFTEALKAFQAANPLK